MKRIWVLLLTLALVFSVTACGGGGGGETAEEEPTPCYVMDSMVVDGEEMTKDDLKELMGIEDPGDYMSFYLAEGGKAFVVAGGEMNTGAWEEKDGDIVLKESNEKDAQTMVLKKDGDTLTYEEDGNKLVFVRTDEMPASMKLDALSLFDPDLSAEEQEAMNTYMLNGSYDFDGGKVYGHFFKDTKACLGVREYQEESSKMGELTVLDENCVPTCVTVSGDYVYYIRMDRDSEEKTLCRVKKDGGDPETLVEETCDYAQVVGDKLSYTDKDGKVVLADLDGKNGKVVVDKECYYVYWLDKDFLLYQDDADDETLHVYYAPAGTDGRLTDTRSLCPVISGKTLWYVKDEGADGKDYRLAKMDLKTKKEEVSEETLSDASFLIRDDAMFLGAYNEEDSDAISMVIPDNWTQLGGAPVDWDKSYSQKKAQYGRYQISWDDEGNGIKIYFWYGDMGESV